MEANIKMKSKLKLKRAFCCWSSQEIVSTKNVNIKMQQSLVKKGHHPSKVLKGSRLEIDLTFSNVVQSGCSQVSNMQQSLISWSNLPVDLLHLVSIKLHICDHLSFRGVCITWRAAASSSSSAKQLSQHSPLLVRQLRVDENCRYFLCPLHDRCYRLSLPGVYKNYICYGSYHGWLLMMNFPSREEIFLLNPFTGARIDLPRGNTTPISRVEVLSAPTDPNCIVILFLFSGWFFKFCRVGADKWTLDSVSPTTPTAPLGACLFKSKLYFLLSSRIPKSAIIAANIATQFKLEFLTLPICVYFRPAYFTYLMESGEELLLVVRYKHKLVPHRRYKHCFAVFKLNIRTSSWVRMKEIADRVLFLGDAFLGKYSASFSATELGCKGNQIYFQYIESGRVTWWVFNMEDRSIKPALSSWDSFPLTTRSVSLFGITPSFV